MSISRPINLFPLFASNKTLSGVGPKSSKLIDKKIGIHLIDLLRHKPTNVICRKLIKNFNDIYHDKIITIKVEIISHNIPPKYSKAPTKIKCKADLEEKIIFLDVVFFQSAKFFVNKLPVNTKMIISGKIEFFNSSYQITHPDYIFNLDQINNIPNYEPIYPAFKGLNQKFLRTIIQQTLTKIPLDIPEWIPKNILNKNKWSDFRTELFNLHTPQNLLDLDINSSTIKRLAFDELLANQLALNIVRKKNKLFDKGKSYEGDKYLNKKLRRNLKFKLTNSQENVIEEILIEQKSSKRMLKLLQGDVGSGKTLVALFAMLNAIECGKQAALLVPNTILAIQHFEKIKEFTESLNIHVVLLIGGQKTKERRQILEDITNNHAKIIIGTHAILYENVIFSSLGIAVIDEQHRFGVNQRLILGQKEENCDILVMSATPIPRTLSMIAYGDLSISKITEKPKGRQNIDTAIVNIDRIKEIYQNLKKIFKNGQQAYWICPKIEDSENNNLISAETRYKFLKELFPEASPTLAHGRMVTDKKNNSMNEFKENKSQLLVATTVVEVGVDIPNATVMIIENAEKFSISQLHQLRGRVGRGKLKSSCILLYKSPLSDIALKRLKILRETNDGFLIAEEDLKLRGPGEILGSKQSGIVDFIFADLNFHSELLNLAVKVSTEIVDNEYELESDEMKPFRNLLSLFERDTAVKFLISG